MACAQTGSGKTVSFITLELRPIVSNLDFLGSISFTYHIESNSISLRWSIWKTSSTFSTLSDSFTNTWISPANRTWSTKVLLSNSCSSWYVRSKKKNLPHLIRILGSAIGGHDMFTVSDRLREGCHILSATTGRLKDMVEKGRVRFNFICHMNYSSSFFIDFVKTSKIFCSWWSWSVRE